MLFSWSGSTSSILLFGFAVLHRCYPANVAEARGWVRPQTLWGEEMKSLIYDPDPDWGVIGSGGSSLFNKPHSNLAPIGASDQATTPVEPFGSGI